MYIQDITDNNYVHISKVHNVYVFPLQLFVVVVDYFNLRLSIEVYKMSNTNLFV